MSSGDCRVSVHDRLEALGISLPPPVPVAGAYAPFVRAGNLLFMSGHIARKDGRPWVGKAGLDLLTEEACAAARGVAVEILGSLQAAAEDLDRIRRIVKVMVLVNSAPGFTEAHIVANSVTELFIEVFGPTAAPARTAFGVAQLPLGACVEVELIAEVV